MRSSPAFFLPASPDAARPSDWVKMAARPGSGVGFLPAALTVQPLATLAAVALATAAALMLRVSPRR